MRTFANFAAFVEHDVAQPPQVAPVGGQLTPTRAKTGGKQLFVAVASWAYQTTLETPEMPHLRQRMMTSV